MADERPSVADVLPMVHELYQTAHGACGGCLHVLLDDGNIEQSNADFCLEWARAHHCSICLPLAEKIARMSNTQRKKLYYKKWHQ